MLQFDQVVQLNAEMNSVREAAQSQEMKLADTRLALRGLLEGVETARASFTRGSREERIVAGAIAGWDAAARVVLGE